MTQTPDSQTEREHDRLPTLRRRLRAAVPFGLGVLATLIAVGVYTAVRPDSAQLTKDDIEETVAQILALATPAPAVSAEVYQAILPSLAIVVTENADVDDDGVGVGTGVIINDSAAILTALHVVDGATDIEVRFADGTQSSAIVVSEQPENDIAVLMPAVPPEVFIPATIGSIGGARVGDEVFTVGNPLGLAASMSAGVISGFDRSFTPQGLDQKLEGVIQFDAAVNPGNSGGPLLDRNGQVIGIVTGLVNPTQQEVFIGISFAVPIDVAARGAGGPAQ